MAQGPQLKMYAFTLDCREPQALAGFYAALLRWETGFHDEEYAWAYAPGTGQGGYPCLLFQRNPEYQPPVWPDAPGAQQQMAHLDIAVDDLARAVAHAVDCGATVAQAQFSQDWTVLFDPAGHPFCLCQMASLFQSAQFALR